MHSRVQTEIRKRPYKMFHLKIWSDKILAFKEAISCDKEKSKTQLQEKCSAIEQIADVKERSFKEIR